MREQIVKFKLLKIQDHSAVVEISMMSGANSCRTMRVRFKEGEFVHVSSDMEFSGDKVTAIGSEARSMIKRARKHETI